MPVEIADGAGLAEVLDPVRDAAVAADRTEPGQRRRVAVEDVTVEHRGSRFAFVMDTRPCPGARALAEGADLLVCESTFLDTEAAIAHEYSHMTVGQAATLARDAGVGTLMLAHFSQRYRNLGAFQVAATKIFPRVVVAKDLLQVPFERADAAPGGA